MSCAQLQIPTVDFRGLSPGLPGGDRWDAARAEAMAALQAFDCFEAVYDVMSTETKEEIFFREVPVLFALPTATKMGKQTSMDLPKSGLPCQIPNFAFESICVKHPDNLKSVEHFGSLMLPGGNPTFKEYIF